MTPKLKRDENIDISRGIGIILVIFAHILSIKEINRVIYFFHMPLFFFLAGMSMVYSYKEDTSFKEYTIKKIKNILVPYFIFSIISFIYWALIERKIRGQIDISIISNFLNIFIAKASSQLYSPNVVMWFLPCMFTTDIMFFALMRLKHKKTIIGINLVIGYFLSINKIILPWSIETALIALSFMYFGYIIKKEEIVNNWYKITFLTILSIIGIIICFITNNEVNMLNHKYSNIILFLLGAYSGIFITIVFLSNFILKQKHFKNIIEYIGQNSLIIMLCSEPLKRLLLKILSIITKVEIEIIRKSIIYSFLCTVMVIIMIFPIIFIFKKYVPFVKNKKYNFNNNL